jgi:hypothetical protein
MSRTKANTKTLTADNVRRKFHFTSYDELEPTTLVLAINQKAAQALTTHRFAVHVVTEDFTGKVAEFSTLPIASGRSPSAVMAILTIPGARAWRVEAITVTNPGETPLAAQLLATVHHAPSGVPGVVVLPGNAVPVGSSVPVPVSVTLDEPIDVHVTNVPSVTLDEPIDVHVTNVPSVTLDEPIDVQASYPKVAEMRALTPGGVAFAGPADYTPTVAPSFVAKRWVLTLDTADSTAIVEYSFDGATVHGRLQLGRCDKISRDVTQPSIWLRYVTAACVVNVHAEGV